MLRIIGPLTLGGCVYLPLFEGTRFDNILHFLADGLWAFAFVSTLLLLWQDRLNITLITLILVAFFGFEYTQAIGLVPGTADLMDVMVYLVSGVLAFALRANVSHGPLVLESEFTRHVLSYTMWSFFVLIAVASGVSKDVVSLENGKVPKEFIGYDGTLLVDIDNAEWWNKYARKAFSKEYHGAVEYVKVSDLSTYTDIDKYRFVVIGVSRYDPGTKNTLRTNILLLDRSSSTYTSTDRTQFFGKLLKEYAKELERVRTL